MASKQRWDFRARKLRAVFEYVYCDRHGTIHEDSLNPYDYEPGNMCDPEDHRTVFAYFKPEELNEPKKRSRHARHS